LSDVKKLVEQRRYHAAYKKLSLIESETGNNKSHLILLYRVYVGLERGLDALGVIRRYLDSFPDDDWGYKAYRTQISNFEKDLRNRINEKNKRCAISKLSKGEQPENLNVGAGGKHITGFIGLDANSEHYGDPAMKGQLPYDMRRESLPVADNKIENIYCEHVIEHLEDQVVQRFIHESARVLKPGGCLRLSCPDAKFLWEVSRFENQYWARRHAWLKARGIDYRDCDQFDFLVREVCTSRLRFPENGDFFRYDSEDLHKIHDDLRRMQSCDEALSYLVSGVSYNEEYPGYHINFWTFERLKKIADPVFSRVIQSKWQGCVSSEMVGGEFDQTAPSMSLYVDCIK
jgi:SAM-dependent methyltransferase